MWLDSLTNPQGCGCCGMCCQQGDLGKGLQERLQGHWGVPGRAQWRRLWQDWEGVICQWVGGSLVKEAEVILAMTLTAELCNHEYHLEG